MNKTLNLVPLLLAVLLSSAFAAEKVTVYKTPSCGCCGKWVDHMRDHGFEVETRDMQNLSMIKSISGVQPAQQSCHTALVDGYVIEGHVPAQDVKRLLDEMPDIRGLAVPGMPMGSPGMEGPRQDRYQVITLEKDGGSRIFARH